MRGARVKLLRTTAAVGVLLLVAAAWQELEAGGGRFARGQRLDDAERVDDGERCE
jgi:hypothetical protein